jgi:RHS repeat-associated protein
VVYQASRMMAIDNVSAGRTYGYDYDVYSCTTQTHDVAAGTTGLYDFLFRQHASSQGRWLVPDPAGMAAVDPTNPQTWNRYAYVSNNPLSNVDPVGLDWDEGQPPPIPWGSNFCGGDPIACALGGWDVCVWAGLCSPGGGSAGGGSGSGGNQPSTPPSTPPSNPPSKPVTFPSETLGVPNGMNVNFGGPLGAILPSAICGDMGPCVAIGSGFGPGDVYVPSQSEIDLFVGLFSKLWGWSQAASREWPLNGNDWPGFTKQDGVCSTGPLAPKMNSNPAILACCQAHDSCYTKYRCNASSWLPGPFPGACSSVCNATAVGCIVNAK